MTATVADATSATGRAGSGSARWSPARRAGHGAPLARPVRAT